MKKSHDPDLGTLHHKHRIIDKRKHHKKGYHEDAPDMRKRRVNFKKYLNSIKESESFDYDDDYNY